ncbi:hypothetical protein EYF80_063645 [Liparis tanakae]|uniref:Uncharacterized protein n=1 Tax=Liparis tanakae TaxID=230148 RepID=A0A4Z2EBS8_9TELE|nr:hypothetical protein EYF80_063645 [Liparis tanakae]
MQFFLSFFLSLSVYSAKDDNSENNGESAIVNVVYGASAALYGGDLRGCDTCHRHPSIVETFHPKTGNAKEIMKADAPRPLGSGTWTACHGSRHKETDPFINFV